MRLKEKLQKKRAEKSVEQRENRLAAKREITQKIVPRNHKNNVKTGSRLKEIEPKESLPRNQKKLEAQKDNAKRKRAEESQE